MKKFKNWKKKSALVWICEFICAKLSIQKLNYILIFPRDFIELDHTNSFFPVVPQLL